MKLPRAAPFVLGAGERAAELAPKYVTGTKLDTRAQTLAVLDEVLGLKGRATRFADTTALLGAIPELDSMAVVGILTALEDRFGFEIDDDEIDGATFATVASLVGFVRTKRGE